MTTPDPLRVTLEFGRGDAQPFQPKDRPRVEYVLRLGEGRYRAAAMTWDDELLQLLRVVRDPRAAAEVTARVGHRLRRFLEAAGWDRHEPAILAAVRQGRPARVAFISDAEELYAPPWELLAVGATGERLCELPDVLVRYQWPETWTAPLQGVDWRWRRTGRALLAWAGAVPHAEQLAAMQEAGPTIELAEVTRPALLEALEADPPVTILQLLCHGVPSGDGVSLAFADGPVDAHALRQLLIPAASRLRLVVLSACEGGGETATNRMGSHAQLLHRGTAAEGGIQAVVSSRFPLSWSGSVVKTRALHRALRQGQGVEGGVLAARAALMEAARAGGPPDHLSLLLHSRGDETLDAPDGDGLLRVRVAEGHVLAVWTASGRVQRLQAPFAPVGPILEDATRAEGEDPLVTALLGEALHDRLFGGELRGLHDEAVAWAARTGRALRLHVEPAGPWAALPWELLANRGAHGVVSVARPEEPAP
ncbi:MAG: CHAT domain-containing protein [Alphaproteobacteria bacterium]|nr:CHAT domain-containing protein [Alphaproteobacteria bacterium]